LWCGFKSLEILVKILKNSCEKKVGKICVKI
jgi:hypothetical protein